MLFDLSITGNQNHSFSEFTAFKAQITIKYKITGFENTLNVFYTGRWDKIKVAQLTYEDATKLELTLYLKTKMNFDGLSQPDSSGKGKEKLQPIYIYHVKSV